ncbi:MAG: transcriptional regulator, partial [Firmicutes bacterium]|nr:transcriptional regulator [Bacillota bacterium]
PNTFFSVPTKYDMLTLPQAVAAYERQYIEQALKNHSTLHEAARNLGIDISTLVRKKKKYEL